MEKRTESYLKQQFDVEDYTKLSCKDVYNLTNTYKEKRIVCNWLKLAIFMVSLVFVTSVVLAIKHSPAWVILVVSSVIVLFGVICEFICDSETVNYCRAFSATPCWEVFVDYTNLQKIDRGILFNLWVRLHKESGLLEESLEDYEIRRNEVTAKATNYLDMANKATKELSINNPIFHHTNAPLSDKVPSSGSISVRYASLFDDDEESPL